jgi:hypothetical protein
METLGPIRQVLLFVLLNRGDVTHLTGELNVYNPGQNRSGTTLDMLIDGACLWELHSCCRMVSSISSG